jgi:hypothetical protein
VVAQVGSRHGRTARWNGCSKLPGWGGGAGVRRRRFPGCWEPSPDVGLAPLRATKKKHGVGQFHWCCRIEDTAPRRTSRRGRRSHRTFEAQQLSRYPPWRSVQASTCAIFLAFSLPNLLLSAATGQRWWGDANGCSHMHTATGRCAIFAATGRRRAGAIGSQTLSRDKRVGETSHLRSKTRNVGGHDESGNCSKKSQVVY